MRSPQSKMIPEKEEPRVRRKEKNKHKHRAVPKVISPKGILPHGDNLLMKTRLACSFYLALLSLKKLLLQRQ